ncbi:hypothetical protein HDU96_010396 [Phlyctochytrium bullatum]|nr:hypothetical protein HDU96_010396 [Phlyctochytrium bullatum]
MPPFRIPNTPHTPFSGRYLSTLTGPIRPASNLFAPPRQSLPRRHLWHRTPPTSSSSTVRRGHRRRQATGRRALALVGSVLLVLAGGGTALVLMQAKEPMTPIEALGVAIAGMGRAAVSFSVGTVLGYKYWRLFGQWEEYTSEEYKKARSKVDQEAAEWLLWLARAQGGIYVKAAQHIASLTYVVPSEFTTTLAVLQDRAPFRPWSVVRDVLTTELGVADLSEVFSDISKTPIAAASLAQVHKARTRDGELVAVKVQYPDVARLFEVDTSTMQLLSDIAGLLFRDFSFGWIVTEFKSSLSTEFDFTNEARNACMTHERFAHRRHAVRCPAVRWDLTGRRVLTMEFVDGVKVNDAAGLRAIGVKPRDVGTLLCEVFAEMVFCHGVVHCDPHPGNVLVVNSQKHPGKPQLVILDHGLYRTLDDRFRLLYCDLWRAMVLNDVGLLRNIAAALGVENQFGNLPLLLTGRPAGSSTPLGGEITKEERDKIRQSFQGVTIADVMSFLEDLPRDMLFAFRVGNLIRGVHRELFLDHFLDTPIPPTPAPGEGEWTAADGLEERTAARARLLARIKEDPVVRSEVSRANAERLAIHARYAIKGRWSVPMFDREVRVHARAEAVESVGRLRGKPLGGSTRRDHHPVYPPPPPVASAPTSRRKLTQQTSKGFGYGGLSLWRPWTLLREVATVVGRVAVLGEFFMLEARILGMKWAMEVVMAWKAWRGVLCDGPVTPAIAEVTKANRKACNACRVRKQRCDGSFPECEKRTTDTVPTAPSHPDPSAAPLPPFPTSDAAGFFQPAPQQLTPLTLTAAPPAPPHTTLPSQREPAPAPPRRPTAGPADATPVPTRDVPGSVWTQVTSILASTSGKPPTADEAKHTDGGSAGTPSPPASSDPTPPPDRQRKQPRLPRGTASWTVPTGSGTFGHWELAKAPAGAGGAGPTTTTASAASTTTAKKKPPPAPLQPRPTPTPFPGAGTLKRPFVPSPVAPAPALAPRPDNGRMRFSGKVPMNVDEVDTMPVDYSLKGFAFGYAADADADGGGEDVVVEDVAGVYVPDDEWTSSAAVFTRGDAHGAHLRSLARPGFLHRSLDPIITFMDDLASSFAMDFGMPRKGASGGGGGGGEGGARIWGTGVPEIKTVGLDPSGVEESVLGRYVFKERKREYPLDPFCEQDLRNAFGAPSPFFRFAMCAICSLIGRPRAPINITRSFYRLARSQLHTVFESPPSVDMVYGLLALSGCSIAIGDVVCGQNMLALALRVASLLNLDKLSVADFDPRDPKSVVDFSKRVFLLRTCVTSDLYSSCATGCTRFFKRLPEARLISLVEHIDPTEWGYLFDMILEIMYGCHEAGRKVVASFSSRRSPSLGGLPPRQFVLFPFREGTRLGDAILPLLAEDDGPLGRRPGDNMGLGGGGFGDDAEERDEEPGVFGPQFMQMREMFSGGAAGSIMNPAYASSDPAAKEMRRCWGRLAGWLNILPPELLEIVREPEVVLRHDALIHRPEMRERVKPKHPHQHRQVPTGSGAPSMQEDTEHGGKRMKRFDAEGMFASPPSGTTVEGLRAAMSSAGAFPPHPMAPTTTLPTTAPYAPATTLPASVAPTPTFHPNDGFFFNTIGLPTTTTADTSLDLFSSSFSFSMPTGPTSVLGDLSYDVGAELMGSSMHADAAGASAAMGSTFSDLSGGGSHADMTMMTGSDTPMPNVTLPMLPPGRILEIEDGTGTAAVAPMVTMPMTTPPASTSATPFVGDATTTTPPNPTGAFASSWWMPSGSGGFPTNPAQAAFMTPPSSTGSLPFPVVDLLEEASAPSAPTPTPGAASAPPPAGVSWAEPDAGEEMPTVPVLSATDLPLFFRPVGAAPAVPSPSSAAGSTAVSPTSTTVSPTSPTSPDAVAPTQDPKPEYVLPKSHPRPIVWPLPPWPGRTEIPEHDAMATLAASLPLKPCLSVYLYHTSVCVAMVPEVMEKDFLELLMPPYLPALLAGSGSDVATSSRGGLPWGRPFAKPDRRHLTKAVESATRIGAMSRVLLVSSRHKEAGELHPLMGYCVAVGNLVLAYAEVLLREEELAYLVQQRREAVVTEVKPWETVAAWRAMNFALARRMLQVWGVVASYRVLLIETAMKRIVGAVDEALAMVAAQ